MCPSFALGTVGLTDHTLIVLFISGMQEWVIEIPSIPFLVSVLFLSVHLKYFRIKFLLLVLIRGALIMPEIK